jgi:hypothetical protein
MRYRLARIAWLTNKSLIRSRSQRPSHEALRSPDFAHVLLVERLVCVRACVAGAGGAAGPSAGRGRVLAIHRS